MKESIFSKFLIVAIIGVIITTIFSFLVVGSIAIRREESQMGTVVKLLQNTIETAENIEVQLSSMKEKVPEIDNIIIANLDGKVIDSTNQVEESILAEEDIDKLQNEEIVFYNKLSDSFLNIHMYAVTLLNNGQSIIVVDKTFSAFQDYLVAYMIVAIVSIAVIGFITWKLANKFSTSLEKPLKEISMEMIRFMEDKLEFHPVKSQYKELNLIVEAAEKMADNVMKYVEKLELEKKVRQEFFSNASHELKTPITSVRGYTELLQNGFAKNETMQADFLSRIQKETDNMTNLINDILMISKLETKEATETMTDVRVYPVIQDIISALTPLANELEVTIDADCSNFVIEASVQQMNQLIGNLVSNAIKYNKPGGIVWIRAYAEKNTMVLIVEDNGIGIDEESKNRVFERFYRVDKGRNKKSGGTGLGLAIVKHIVQYYDGTIVMDSTIGIGTKFTVRLPLKRKSHKNIMEA